MEQAQVSTSVSTKQENPIISLIANIVLPVLILDKFSEGWGTEGPKLALLLAIGIQLTYAFYDYHRRRKVSPIFVLGFLNVLLTGGFGLLSLGGLWFAIKEATFPLLIGIFVFISSYTKKPFIEMILLNPQVVDRDKLLSHLEEKGTEPAFHQHLRLSTRLFSLSFFLSATLNYWLARQVFLEIDPSLDEYARQVVLNQQIAQMTWRSFLVIMLPSMVCFFAVMWYLFAGIKKLSGLKITDIFKAE